MQKLGEIDTQEIHQRMQLFKRNTLLISDHNATENKIPTLDFRFMILLNDNTHVISKLKNGPAHIILV